MIALFRKHPGTVGETYWQHLRFATRTGAAMLAAGGACVVHGLFPFLFVTTGSRAIRSLAQRLERRGGPPPAAVAWAGAVRRS